MSQAIVEAIEKIVDPFIPHYYCEDSWYSCPKAEDGCADDNKGDECGCGKKETVSKIAQAINDEVISKLRVDEEEVNKALIGIELDIYKRKGVHTYSGRLDYTDRAKAISQLKPVLPKEKDNG